MADQIIYQHISCIFLPFYYNQYPEETSLLFMPVTGNCTGIKIRLNEQIVLQPKKSLFGGFITKRLFKVLADR